MDNIILEKYSEETYGLTKEKWLEWKKKRRNTLIAFVLIGIAVGIDCSVLFSTLFVYLRDLVKTDRPEMWYGLIIAFFYVSSTFLGTVCGRWLDKTRSVRVYVNFVLFVQIVGFVLYTLPYHPSLLLMGRAICGIGEPFTSVVAGEVFRIHEKDASTRAMLILASVYSFGFIIGPSLNFLFLNIDFHIGTLRVNHLNFIGIFMVGLMSTVMFITNFLVHDCSKEFDLKAYLKLMSSRRHTEIRKIPNGENKSLQYKDEVYNVMVYERAPIETSLNGECKSLEYDSVTIGDSKSKLITKSSDEAPSSSSSEDDMKRDDMSENSSLLSLSKSESNIAIHIVIRQLLTNKDTLLIIVSTFIFMYGIFAACTILPVLVIVNLHWGIKSLSYIYVGIGIADFFILLLMARYCNSNRSVYFTGVACIVSQIVTCVLLICFKVLQRNYNRDVFMMILFLLSTTLGWCFDDVLIRVIFANMIPSHIQSFSETIRSGVSRVGIVAGSFTVTALLPWVDLWSIIVMVLNVILLLGFLVRGKYLINPTELTFDDGKKLGRNYGSMVVAVDE